MPDIRIGLWADSFSRSLSQVEDEAAFASEAGLKSIWYAQSWRFDVLTMIPHLARGASPDLEFGTAVLATHPRHPLLLATQTLTANLIAERPITLGIGVTHRPMIEGMFNIPFDRPVRWMNEYLDVLFPLLKQEEPNITGTMVSYRGPIDVPNAPPSEVLVAAMGTQMLRLCGKRAGGTITWMTGPKVLRNDIVPTINDAAEQAGRPKPRVIAIVPVLVTDDISTARTGKLNGYNDLPTYRAMLDREGLAMPADFAIVGSEDAVLESLAEYADAGATELAVYILSRGEDRERTRALLRSLASDSSGLMRTSLS
jgi:5,10-methylenetetrahydromethanopterin reductase